MTTIYVDSRKRVAGSDSDFEVDLGESLHMQSDARLAVYKIRIADSFLSTDRGRYLYWVDAALGTLNWALLPEGEVVAPSRTVVVHAAAGENVRRVSVDALVRQAGQSA